MSEGRLPKASDLVAERIRAEILSKRLPSGHRLPSEAEFIQTLDRSRGTVREGLRLLETEGLISIKRGPGGGITVSRPEVNQISRSLAVLLTLADATVGEFFEFRKAFEPVVAAAAATNATDEQRRDLLASLDDGADAATAEWGASGRYPEFHQFVAACSNNAVYVTLAGSLHQLLDWHTESETLSSRDYAGTVKAHLAIARAIVRCEPKAAAAAMLKHIGTFEKVLAEQGRLGEPIIPPRRWGSA